MTENAKDTKPAPLIEAIAFAKEVLSGIELSVNGEHKLPDGSTTKITKAVLKGAHLAAKICYHQTAENSKNPHLFPVHEIRRELKELIEKSRMDPSAFDQLATCSKVCLKEDTKMPSDLRDWACCVLDGSVSRPPTPRNKLRAKENDLVFDLSVKRAVEEVAVKFGCPIQSENSQRWSACEAVAKALFDMGLKPTTALQVYRVTTRAGGVNLELARVTADKLSKVVPHDPFTARLVD